MSGGDQGPAHESGVYAPHDAMSRLDPGLRYKDIRPGTRLRGARARHGKPITYRIYRRLRDDPDGKGTYGLLWRAFYFHPESGLPTRIAIKVLDEEQMTGGSDAVREFERGLNRGAHVVAFYDHSPDGALPAWVAMEYLKGDTLERQVVRHGPLVPDDLGKLLIAIASALENFYKQKPLVYHGDWSPKNIVGVHQALNRSAVELYKVVDLGHGHREATQTKGSKVRMASYVTPEEHLSLDDLTVPANYIDVHLAAQVIWFATTGQSPTRRGFISLPRDLISLPSRVPGSIDPELRELVADMLTFDIVERSEKAPIEIVVLGLREIAGRLGAQVVEPPAPGPAFDPHPPQAPPVPPARSVRAHAGKQTRRPVPPTSLTPHPPTPANALLGFLWSIGVPLLLLPLLALAAHGDGGRLSDLADDLSLLVADTPFEWVVFGALMLIPALLLVRVVLVAQSRRRRDKRFLALSPVAAVLGIGGFAWNADLGALSTWLHEMLPATGWPEPVSGVIVALGATYALFAAMSAAAEANHWLWSPLAIVLPLGTIAAVGIYCMVG